MEKSKAPINRNPMVIFLCYYNKHFNESIAYLLVYVLFLLFIYFLNVIPAILVSGANDEIDATPEGGSSECMGPPAVAGTSTETSQPLEQSEDMLEGEDGVNIKKERRFFGFYRFLIFLQVTSEGEKTVMTGEGEEEGREAEASPSTNTRTRSQTQRGSGGVARRSMRMSHAHTNMSRSGPTPIVWSEQRSTRHQGIYIFT